MVIFSLFVGSSNQAGFGEYIQLFYQNYFGNGLNAEQQQSYEIANNIILNIRLPRVLLTFIIGAALSVSGAVLQGILRNPLVDSYILGISSASAFGAALAIITALLPINIMAFLFGLVSVLITFGISKSRQGEHNIVSVVLSGMIVSGIFTALLSIAQYISNPYKVMAIVQWTLGNLHSATWQEVEQSYPYILICLIIVFVLRWRLNLLALGDDAAKAVGVNPILDKYILIVAATLMTATSVAAAGIISMYGLFLPHIVRMISGADHKKVIPGSLFFGGTFLLVIDNFSRSLFEFEVPVGIFTMLLGGLFFIYLMRKNKLNWN